MERGKRNAIITTSLVIGLIVLGIFLEYITLPPSAPSLAPTTPNIPYPENCNPSTIGTAWDQIFIDTSAGITILSNNTQETPGPYCDFFIAYKEVGDTLSTLMGVSINETSNSNISQFLAIKLKDSTENINGLKTSYQEIINDPDGILSFILLQAFYIGTNETQLRTVPIAGIPEAHNQFPLIYQTSLLNLTQSDWTKNFNGYNEEAIFGFEREESISNGAVTTHTIVAGSVFQNTSAEILSFGFFSELCTPDWQPHNTTCDSDEKIIETLIDENFCGIPFKNEKNQNLDCDYDKNGIIGSLSNIDLSNINLDFKINESGLNLSKTYTNTQNIKILDGSKLKVQTSWNFATPLNLKNISIKKQPTSSDNGYLIINGIPASKTIYVDQKDNSTNSVCVKNMKINSISEIDSDCNGTSETLLPCPGSESGYICILSNNTFTISGLTNSAAEEFLEPDSGCEPFFNCTNWGVCINNNQNRTCTDLNTCLPNRFENQSCSIFPPPPSCTEKWNCTNWQPSTCPKNETQTKFCTDINNCGTIDLKPNTTQSCEYKQNKTWIIVILIAVLIGLILIVAAIFVIYLIKNKKQEEENFYY